MKFKFAMDGHGIARARWLISLSFLLALASVVFSLRAFFRSGWYSDLIHTDSPPDSDPLRFTFHVPPSDPVIMHIEDSARYQLDDTGALDYAILQPPSLGRKGKGHLVFIKDKDDDKDIPHPPKAYTVTMLHQLKCLEIYHREYLELHSSSPPSSSASGSSPDSPSGLPGPSRVLSHCLNYLRQTILCQMDTTLESVRSPKAQSDRAYDGMCRDWMKVYQEVERNRRVYGRWVEEQAGGMSGDRVCD